MPRLLEFEEETSIAKYKFSLTRDGIKMNRVIKLNVKEGGPSLVWSDVIFTSQGQVAEFMEALEQLADGLPQVIEEV